MRPSSTKITLPVVYDEASPASSSAAPTASSAPPMRWIAFFSVNL